METIIGFAVGYIAGAQKGKAGLDRIRTSLRAIAESPQTRRIAADAITLAGLIIRRLTEPSSD